MTMFIFTVRDSKVEAYLPPFLSTNAGTAIRLLVDAARDQGSMLNMHPEDFQLFAVGKFNESTGQVSSIDHISYGKLIDFMEERTREKG